jgi:hypothetical protein
MQERF